MSGTRLSALARAGALLILTLGLLLRFGLKDRFALLGPAPYVLQYPVLAGVCAVSGVLAHRVGRFRSSGPWLLTAAALLVLWWGTRSVWHRCGDTRADFRILEWNVAHGFTGWEGIAREIRSRKAQIIALVEADAPDTERFWRERFPGYAVRSPGKGMVLMVKGEILGGSFQEFGVKSRLAILEARIGDRPLRILLVDLEANPLSPRQPLVRRVASAASLPALGPTLVAGDFNTPADSVWIDDLRGSRVEAFETAGKGMLATWPVPIPLLHLDQIWASGGLRPVCAGKQLSWRSDHAAVWADLAFSGR